MRLCVKREACLADLVRMGREYNYPVAVNWQGMFEMANEYNLDSEIGKQDQIEEPDGTIGDQGHYSVVIDVDTANNYIRIIDPYGHYAEKDRFFMIQEFLGRWWDDRMDYEPDGSKKYVYENRLMFVVLPKELRFPEELGMVEV